MLWFFPCFRHRGQNFITSVIIHVLCRRMATDQPGERIPKTATVLSLRLMNLYMLNRTPVYTGRIASIVKLKFFFLHLLRTKLCIIYTNRVSLCITLIPSKHGAIPTYTRWLAVAPRRFYSRNGYCAARSATPPFPSRRCRPLPLLLRSPKATCTLNVRVSICKPPNLCVRQITTRNGRVILQRKRRPVVN